LTEVSASETLTQGLFSVLGFSKVFGVQILSSHSVDTFIF